MPIILIFFLLASYCTYLSIYKPRHNWDMIGYIAAAKSFEEPNVERLHSFTYDQLRIAVSEACYKKLVSSDRFSSIISTDASALKEMLPFYQIRPLYTGLVYLLYKSGVNIGFATHIVSGVSIVASVVVLFFMAVSFLPKQFIYAVPPLALLFQVENLARLSTPDGLAFFAVALSSFLYMKKQTTQLLILLPIIIGIRTDLILYTIPLLSFIFIFENQYRLMSTVSIFMSVAIYWGICAYCKNPGWAIIFSHTLVHKVTHPISMSPTLTVSQYIHVLIDGSKNRLLVDNGLFVLYCFVSACSLYMLRIRKETSSFVLLMKSPSATLPIVFIVFVVCHFLLFPVTWVRFFSAPYLIGTLALLMQMVENHTSRNDNDLG